MELMKKVTTIAVMATLFASATYAADMSEMIKEGRKIFTTKSLGNCLGCHSVQGDESIPQTGNLGPKLANLDTYPKEYLFEKIWDPNKTEPNTIMPPMGRNHKITKVQIEALIVYLQETTKAK